MTTLPVQTALDYLDGTLMHELPVARVDGPTRTKVQIFELPKSGRRQFGVQVYDRDAASGRFGHGTTRIYLEYLPEAAIADVELLPDHRNNGSRFIQSDSRLTPGKHRAVMVGSLEGLRGLLEWYCGTPTTAQGTTSTTPRAEPHHTFASQMTQATNTILYGPPGTGKTYATSRRAVLLCDGEVPGDVGLAAIRRRFEELRLAGRVSFVTFHQSYGYEEFVEGLRPHVGDTGQVVYGVRPGVFKSACVSAKLRSLVTPGLKGKPLKERTIYKMSLGATWKDEGKTVFDYCIKNQCVLLGWGGDVDFSECSDKDEIEKQLALEQPSMSADLQASSARFVDNFKHEMKPGDIVVVSLGNKLFRAIAEVTGEYEFLEDAPFHQMRAVRWLAVFENGKPAEEIYEKNVKMGSLYKLNPTAIKFDRLQELLNAQTKTQPGEPHVFIIDEINRANISKVFGELITLIEPDKREGESNAVTVKLPYSDDEFSVPANLHILGTMNTADRSIALLDTALRRRFEFEELMPDPSCLAGRTVQGIELDKLLAAMNERIELLYDRDHTIGHAYLLNVETLADLDSVFRHRVLPLLQEYFFENWSKVRRVLCDLGDGDFIKRVLKAPVPFDGDEGVGEEPSVVYSVNQAKFPAEAYMRVYVGA